MLNLLGKVWSWIKDLNPDIVRLICMGLIVWVIGHYTLDGVVRAIRYTNESEQVLKERREQYTIQITPKINQHIKDILLKDHNASNVILLNYHNTLISSNGLSYRFLTALCEQFQGDDSKPTIDYWKELDYMNYGEEIQKINAAGAYVLDSIQKYRNVFPKFTYILERSEFKSAVIYPLMGVDDPLGMIIVGYRTAINDLDLTYVRKVIAPNIQPLATLLDYNYYLKVKNEKDR